MTKVEILILLAIGGLLLAVSAALLGRDSDECSARGGVLVYSSPIAGGIPLAQCVAAPPLPGAR